MMTANPTVKTVRATRRILFPMKTTAAEKKMARMTDAELAYTLRDLSETLACAMEMGRDGSEPKCRQYVAEMAAAQTEQAKRAARPS